MTPIPLSTKKIQMLNHKKDLVKESTVYLSSRISQFNHMIDDFKLSPHNPIRLQAEEVTRQYKLLSEAIGKLHKEMEKTTDEILNFEEN